MQHWLIIASLIITGLFLAWSTYSAGLRFYGAAIGLTGALGYLLVACSALLFLSSLSVMKGHKVGPFAAPAKKTKS